jgi:hypothetical protein
MTHVPITLALFAALIGVSVLLRIRWPRLSRRLRRVLIASAMSAILLQVLIHVIKWSPNSDRAYRLLSWAAIAGYVFLMILWTRVSPRWLTTLCAVILILPLLGPTLLFPLASLFATPAPLDTQLTDTLFSEILHWRSAFGGTSGVDVGVYYRPVWAPFIRHSGEQVRLYDNQCNTAAVSVVLSADHKRAMVSCPPWPGQPTEQSYDLILPVR